MGILRKIKNATPSMSLFIMGLFVIVLQTNPAFAQAAGGGIDLSPITTFVTGLSAAIVGPLGRAIAVVAIIAIGFMAFSGRMNWMQAGTIILGIVIIFGAAVIAPSITGTGTP